MNKNILTAVGFAILLNGNAQKLQLTEAATEYKNNYKNAWMMQPDQLESNKSVLLKAKKAIDESYAKQTESPMLKEKDKTKMYYYRGMIYLDYIMMASMDEGIMKELETMEEEQLESASLGSLKKCIELDTKNQWKSEIIKKLGGLRGMMFNAGAEMFNQKNYEAAYEAFDGSVKMYDVLGETDTLAMYNAALAAEKVSLGVNNFSYNIKYLSGGNYTSDKVNSSWSTVLETSPEETITFDVSCKNCGKVSAIILKDSKVVASNQNKAMGFISTSVDFKAKESGKVQLKIMENTFNPSYVEKAFDYFKMCADNNYGNEAEMYMYMIRVLTSDAVNNKDDEKILAVIDEGKKKYPNDFGLFVEEFNFWYNKGDNEKAQKALQKAIEANPTDKILHFNIGVTYDNLAKTEHEAKNHVKAFEYIEKAVIGYKSAIELDSNYVDAYYNLGALYVNESQEIQSIANDYDGEKYEQEMKRGQETMQKGIPYLEKVLTFTPNDKSTLSVLKIIYANMDDMENYKRIKALLEAAN